LIGDNYFGEDNCECLCKSCEDLCQNGWTADEGTEAQAVPKLSIEEPEGYSFRRRRRLESTPMSRDQSETPDVNIRPKISKTPRSLSRFKNVEGSPHGESPSVESNLTPLKRKRELDLLSPSPAPKKPKKIDIVKQEETEVALPTTEAADDNPSPTTSRSESAQLSPAPSSNNEATVTDATSVDEDTIIVQPLLNPTISKLRRTRGANIPDPLEQANAGATILVGQSTSAAHPVLQDDNTSILSELPSDFELDESSMSITVKSPAKKRKRELESDPELDSSISTPKPSTRKRSRKLPPPKTDVDHAPPIRVPGDYVLTPALLAEPASSWIVCKICEEAFVQKDAYFTRSSCPRCERHSKLYGYMWPKTDKEGNNDTEDRVLDHRTVHRFIRPQEERSIRKRDRGSTVSRAETREESEAVVEEGRRGKRAKRFTM
jgi:histone-lysine N-methyltransferase SUV420H